MKRILILCLPLALLAGCLEVDQHPNWVHGMYAGKKDDRPFLRHFHNLSSLVKPRFKTSWLYFVRPGCFVIVVCWLPSRYSTIAFSPESPLTSEKPARIP